MSSKELLPPVGISFLLVSIFILGLYLSLVGLGKGSGVLSEIKGVGSNISEKSSKESKPPVGISFLMAGLLLSILTGKGLEILLLLGVLGKLV